MPRPLIIHFTVLLLSASARPAAAEVRLDATLVARDPCPAPKSIRTGANPGEVKLEPGKAYRVVAKNKEAATHYRVEIEGAEPKRRWVAIACGELQGGSATSPTPTPTAVTPSVAPQYVLAVSWQPGFCETSAGQDKPECTAQTEDRFDASHFSLHGLWPQPRRNRYCGVPPAVKRLDESHRWDELQPVELSPELRQRLDERMPGTRSHLERHEWTTHGTCYGSPAEEYFREALMLLDQLNASEVRTLFRGRVGERLTAAEVRAAFDAAFGPGSGERVFFTCQNNDPPTGRRIFTELRLWLHGNVDDQSTLAALLAASPPTNVGCPDGMVDAVGLQ